MEYVALPGSAGSNRAMSREVVSEQATCDPDARILPLLDSIATTYPYWHLIAWTIYASCNALMARLSVLSMTQAGCIA